MEFKIDASDAYVVKRPIYRRISGKKNFEGIEGIPFVKSKIKVGDKLNIIGKVVDDSEYPILIKAKVIKNISRRQLKISVLKRLLLKKIKKIPGIREKVKKEVKEKVRKKKLERVKKRIKRKIRAQDLRKQIQELLRRVQEIRSKIK